VPVAFRDLHGRTDIFLPKNAHGTPMHMAMGEHELLCASETVLALMRYHVRPCSINPIHTWIGMDCGLIHASIHVQK
jgi:hypothetical protein